MACPHHCCLPGAETWTEHEGFAGRWVSLHQTVLLHQQNPQNFLTAATAQSPRYVAFQLGAKAVEGIASTCSSLGTALQMQSELHQPASFCAIDSMNTSDISTPANATAQLRDRSRCVHSSGEPSGIHSGRGAELAQHAGMRIIKYLFLFAFLQGKGNISTKT